MVKPGIFHPRQARLARTYRWGEDGNRGDFETTADLFCVAL